MANNSYQPTYTTKRLTFVENINPRTGTSNSKDASLINFYPTEVKGIDGVRYYIEQRGGLVYQQGTVAGVGRGIYYWNGSTFWVVDNTLYKDGTSVQTLTTTTGTVTFQEFANGTNQKFLIVLDGTNGYVIKTDFTITKITSANFPSPHTVHSGYLDGYLILGKIGTADLYNCNLEDPLTWTAGDFISAETYPDPVVALCRQNNYIVAVGTQTTEFFYDSGVYPGTPLARNSAALHQIGTPSPDSLIQSEEQVIFIGQTQTGGRTIVLFNGFNPADISTEPLRKSLDAEGTNISNAKAFLVRNRGRKFYVLNLTSVSWVYDFDTQMWHQWADYTGTARFTGDYASDSAVGSPLVLDRSKGFVYVMTDGVTYDSITTSTTAPITCTVVTDKYDFSSMNNKFMHRFALVWDRPEVTTSGSLSLSWTDDDYNSYNTPRALPMGQTMPCTTQLGMFRRRAFKLVYSGAVARFEGFEVDINAGSQ